MAFEIKNLSIDLLELNEGQMYGLPKNPRWIRDARFTALKKSIEDAPEMLGLREILVYPLDDVEGHEGKYIIIGGNQRYRACTELGYNELPCKVIPLETPVKKLREYVIKDNEAFGQNDYDLLSSEWDDEELRDFGMELDYIAPGGGDGWDEMDDPDGGSGSKGDGDDSMYSRKIVPPVYEIRGEEPTIEECVDMTPVHRLLDEINASNVPEAQKEMLRVCAYRHAVIHFDKVAEYYAHQNSEMQDLMENNALVIIDYDKALERGFIEMTSRLQALIPDADKGDGLSPEEVEDVDAGRYSDDETYSDEE